MTKTLNTDDPIEQRLRYTLHTVSGTLTEAQFPVTELPGTTRRAPIVRPHSRRRIALAGGALVIPVVLAAAAFVHSGPEYVDAIPAEDIIVSGNVDGSQYLLIESTRTECGKPVTGVELVEEKENLIGSEWNTIGEQYGERTDCGVQTERFLQDPVLHNASGTRVGDSFVWLWAVHPDVTAVRITAADFAEDLPVYPVDGAGYALLEIPTDLSEYTVELLIDGQVVPGSAETHTVPGRG